MLSNLILDPYFNPNENVLGLNQLQAEMEDYDAKSSSSDNTIDLQFLRKSLNKPPVNNK